jgi:hypothetical protein
MRHRKSAPTLGAEPCSFTELFSVAISASPHLRRAMLDDSAFRLSAVSASAPDDMSELGVPYAQALEARLRGGFHPVLEIA